MIKQSDVDNDDIQICSNQDILTDNREGETELLSERQAQLSTFTEENSYDLGHGGEKGKETVKYL
jgi:hypothetical protein